ncbi:THUMP-like domain-containing protein [Candidatus Oscillochloris fontis]|uniref:THUMP-like domain-containing protein n=1 Tax=Candidatus Oscillochloris fontis TaxID=2496868 RepID=UPI001EE93007|nr:SAM-dependent methyltransferase [Candidatus Oscillochloris fontis]
MMDLDTLNWLQSPPGQALLAELAVRPLGEADLLGEITRLRRHFAADLVRAAVELARLRQRATAKFPAAERMFFTREALEQSSAAAVAAHRATRLAPAGQVADLCCGVGGDALALAAGGAEVQAVDRDPLRLAMVAANATALGLAERVHPLQRDLLAEPPPAAAALFCDPGRRADGRRRFAVEEYEPPLSHILSWQRQTPALAVKLAPGVDLAALPSMAEVEFVSLHGELKEALLWCGPLAQVARRATLLDGTGHTAMLVQPSPPTFPPAISPPLAYLYEPDPAVIRAGLVADLAVQMGAAQLDPQIAYLTAAHLQPTPFARAWPIHSWQPFNLKRLRASLRELAAGAVTVKKRGSPLDTDTLARQLSGDGPNPLVVVLTRHYNAPIMLICGPPIAFPSLIHKESR